MYLICRLENVFWFLNESYPVFEAGFGVDAEGKAAHKEPVGQVEGLTWQLGLSGTKPLHIPVFLWEFMELLSK